MTRVVTAFVLALAAGTLLVLAAPAPASAQEDSPASEEFTLDENLANQGSSLWRNTGCMGCHTIGKGPSSGPDLKDVHERRSMDWLVQFLTNTDEMLDTDPVAMELLEEYRGVRMPNLRLREAQAKALIHYIARQSAD